MITCCWTDLRSPACVDECSRLLNPSGAEQRDRERQSETERDRERQSETERDRARQSETEEREGGGGWGGTPQEFGTHELASITFSCKSSITSSVGVSSITPTCRRSASIRTASISAVLSTEGRVVGPSWEHLKPKGPKNHADLQLQSPRSADPLQSPQPAGEAALASITPILASPASITPTCRRSQRMMDELRASLQRVHKSWRLLQVRFNHPDLQEKPTDDGWAPSFLTLFFFSSSLLSLQVLEGP